MERRVARGSMGDSIFGAVGMGELINCTLFEEG